MVFFKSFYPMTTKLPLILLLMLAGCSVPSDFNRDNPDDPKSSAYVVANPGWIQLYPFGKHPRVTWGIASILPDITIERKIGEGPWVDVATVSASDSLYVDVDITIYAPQTYRYRLHAHHMGQKSDTLTSWPIVVSPQITFPVELLPASYPSLLFRGQGAALASRLENDTLFTTIRMDTVRFERRIGEAPFEIFRTAPLGAIYDDIHMTASALQYRFTPWYMGQFHDESFTTPYLDRYLMVGTSQNLQNTRMGFFDTWTSFDTWNGLLYRPAVYLASSSLWRMYVLRPDGSLITNLNIRPAQSVPFLDVTAIRFALSNSRFAFVENSRRLVLFPFAGDPTAAVQILPNHQTLWDVAFNESGSVLYASFSDNSEPRHDIRSLTDANGPWETVHTLNRAAEWFAIDSVANRLHTIETASNQQTWVTRQWSDGRVLYSAPISGRVNQVAATSTGFQLLSGHQSGNRSWLVDPEAGTLQEIVFEQTHRFMVATSEPGIALRAIGEKLFEVDSSAPSVVSGRFILPTTIGHRWNITALEPTHLIEFDGDRTRRHIGNQARYEFRTTP